MLKITTVVGTRPELIRMSSCIQLFDKVFKHRLIHTGQNSDTKLSTVFFENLEIRQPDVYMNCANSSFATFLSQLFLDLEVEFIQNRPDAVVLLGDTNSALCSLLAKRMNIPTYHLEAGNRSFDENVPEEINRRLIDHVADFHLAYTERSRSHLIAEGVHPRTTSVIGSPLSEVINTHLHKVKESTITKDLGLTAGDFFLVSIHRQENIDEKPRLTALISALREVSNQHNLPLLVSSHPRLRNKLAEHQINSTNHFIHCDPFSFTDYLRLQVDSKLVISDSGSVSEEAAILGFKAVTVRDSTERPEAIEHGTVILGGTQLTHVTNAVQLGLDLEIPSSRPSEYLIQDTSKRVVNFIQSTLPQYAFWKGIRFS